jgi:phosphopantetheine adenylyltransferase
MATKKKSNQEDDVFDAMVYGGAWEMVPTTTLAFKGLKVTIVEKKSKKVLFMSKKNYTMCCDVVTRKKNGVKKWDLDHLFSCLCLRIFMRILG